MKKYFFLFLIGSIMFAQNKTIEQRIDSVLSKMTIEEKTGQLVQYSRNFATGTKTENQTETTEDLIRKGKIGSFLNVVGANATGKFQKIAVEESRLKIPLIFGLDVIHGYRATFPIPLAEASSWNAALVESSARWQAIEASSAGLHWTFNPMVDIARDPRWGRTMEGSGEDPYLGSVMAAARVKGYQGKNLSDNNTIAACVKHFAAYGAAEGGRDYNTVDISERTLRQVYLPPFKAAVEAGAATLMASFNEIAGVPSSANHKLLTDILRGEWKFDGFVVSDWNSVGELVKHGIAADLIKATEMGIKAGVDMDMESNGYYRYLPELVKEGKVPMSVLDESVRRVLRIKFRLGLFDDPFKYCDAERESKTIMSKEIVEATKQVALESIVLLKNENKILPLSRNTKFAVVGPLANSKDDVLGGWSAQGKAEDAVSFLEGFKNKLGNEGEINYAEGCKVLENDKSGFAHAVEAAKSSDVVIAVVGESRKISGEARSRSSLDLPGVQEDLLKEIQKTGKPIVVVLMNGRPLSINWAEQNAAAILETWFLGIQAGNAIADVLFGDYNPSGKLTITFPRSAGQIPYYYNHKNTGRPHNPKDPFTSYYLDVENTPLYPFGYGLSYTTFDYSNLSVSKSRIKKDEPLNVTVDIKNSGTKEGNEVVQLYIRDLMGSVTRPVLELKDFSKISLKPGETKQVEFTIAPEKLKFYDINMNYVEEPGDFKVYVGPNSVELKEASFTVTE